ncbi:MAG: rhomboid family intramembrane serine protease [Acidobacteria bacterium]|nr:rhomboid family intramembrane serine protease [Acidobacteriota bacterium]
MDKRRMCPNCRAFITTDDKQCEYCGVALGVRAIDLRMPDDLLGGLLPGQRFLATLLVMVCSGLYVATIVYSMKAGNPHALTDIDGRTLIAFGGKFGPAMLAGQWWRLVTAGFLHGGIMHIMFNMWSLLDVGAHAEELYGSSRMWVIFVVSTITGFWLSHWWRPMGLSIGASAGLFGLMGAMFAHGVKWERTAYGAAIKTVYYRALVYGIVASLLIPMIDMGAHIGGLAGGFAVGWVADEPNKSVNTDRAWDWAARIALAVVALCFFRAVTFLLPTLLAAD